MQKLLPLTVILLMSSSIFSQNKKLNTCLLINKQNDTVSFIGKKLNSLNVHNGFYVFNEYGKKTGIKVEPDNFTYLILKDSINGNIKFKSIKKIKGALYTKGSKNAFMQIGIENDLKSGKLSVYAHKYQTSAENFFLYIEDLNGMHLVYTKKDVISYIGKDSYRMYNASKKRLLFFTNNIK